MPPPIEAPRIEIERVLPLQVDRDAVRVRVGAHVLGLERVREAAVLRQLEGVLQARVVDLHAERRPATSARSVPWPRIVFANAECSSNRASTGSSSSRARATRESRQAPAVCEEDGPTMTGPTMSRSEITRASIGGGIGPSVPGARGPRRHLQLPDQVQQRLARQAELARGAAAVAAGALERVGDQVRGGGRPRATGSPPSPRGPAARPRARARAGAPADERRPASQSAAAWAIAFCSSRTLPGHGCAPTAPRRPRARSRSGPRPYSRAYRSRK